jgi:hypothetical protein
VIREGAEVETLGHRVAVGEVWIGCIPPGARGTPEIRLWLFRPRAGL